MIRFDNVSLRKSKGMVLHHVSLSIDPSECVCITGPSGSGKSLLLNMLTRDIHPTTGAVSIDGINLAVLTPSLLQRYRRSIGVMLQDDQLLNDRSVASNIALPLEMKNLNLEEMAIRTSALLEAVGLYEKAAALPESLDRGEKRRAALAQALASKPIILIADEPVADIDPESRRIILTLLKNAYAAGTTVIVSTRNTQHFEGLNTRIIHLRNGSIIEQKRVAKRTTSVTLEHA